MSSGDRHGATSAEWAHFSKTLGLTTELLPCVLNPGATISPASSMKKLGKTPSWYNRQGLAVGIQEWPQRQTTEREVRAWSAVEDYGLCIQTRRVRAMDIDVPDRAKAEAIARCIEDIAGVGALRFRADSGKRLIPFVCEGSYAKLVLQVDGGMIEFLANGRQFVGAGRHEDGQRYEWRDGLPTEFPVWSDETLAEVMAALDMAFGIEAQGWSTGGSGRTRRALADEDGEEDLGTDEVADWLEQNWPNFGRQKGMLLVECPWKVEHSMDSGDTQSVWLIRGTRGYEQGHYRCQHGHCNDRGREAFLEAVGWVESGFDVIEAPKAESTKEGLNGHAVTLPWPGFDRKENSGIIKASIGNVVRALRYAEVCGWKIAYDSFIDDLTIGEPEKGTWRPIAEGDPVRLRITLETNRPGGCFEPIGREMMRDALIAIGEENLFDSAVDWVERLPPWDGVARCERFFIDYMPGEDNAYGRAMGRYVWSAHAGRVMSPGCQVDMSPVLIGAQGLRKSSGVRAIAPDIKFYAQMGFHEDEKERARKMRGRLVAEMDELRGLNSKESDEIKAFMSRPVENWTPKFKERAITFPRRLLFWGTSNEDEILADSTGERRWLPRQVRGLVDVAAIERDRDQLWAEGLALWREHGVVWQEAESLAALEHDAYRVSDMWEDRIAQWLDNPSTELHDGRPPREWDGFRVEQIASEALHLSPGQFEKRHEQRIVRILRALKCASVVKRVDGRVQRLWICAK